MIKSIAEMDEQELAVHVVKFRPAVPVAKPPHNMPLWWDISHYFCEIFEQHPWFDVILFTAETLIEDMQTRFNVLYNDDQLEALNKMLHVEYRQIKGEFEFLRVDFIKQVTV